MRVLVLWADNRSANLGVRVLAEGARSVALATYGPGTEVVFQDLGPNEEGFRVSTDLVKKDLARPRGPIKTWLRQFDAVLDTGAGDSFTDIYGRNRFARMAYTQLAARRVGLPVVLLPQTIGPFDDKLNRVVARRALKRASVVVTRDHTSESYARSLGRKDVIRSTDLVFSLPSVQQPKSRDVVLNVSGLLWGSDKHVDSKKYRNYVNDFITELVSRGRHVSLLPHVLDNSTPDNDMIPIRELERTRHGEVDVLIPESLDEARRAVASASLVVGSRMHACLNALSVGTPAVPWAYSRKFKPLLDDVGWEYTVDLRSADNPVAETLEHMDSEDALRAALKPVLETARSRIGSLSAALSAAA